LISPTNKTNVTDKMTVTTGLTMTSKNRGKAYERTWLKLPAPKNTSVLFSATFQDSQQHFQSLIATKMNSKPGAVVEKAQTWLHEHLCAYQGGLLK
jgi:hypothetical protein